MDAHQHPSYRRVRDKLVSTLRTRLVRTHRESPVVFLCGGAESKARPFLRDYFGAHRPGWLVFYADDVWRHVESEGTMNSLDMERELAALADAVLIVVESPGTFTELGAFAMQDDLRRKLLVLMDQRYEHHASFINTGPARWVNERSAFGACVYCALDPISPSVSRIIETLDRSLPSTSAAVTSAEARESPRHLLLLLADLVAIMGPAKPQEIRLALEGVVEGRSAWRVDTMIGLALSLDLIASKNPEAPLHSQLFYRPLVESSPHGLLIRDTFDIRRARASFIECYQRVPGEWTIRFPLPVTPA